MKLLIIEDEKYMAQAVAEVLKKNKYTVDIAYDGEYGTDCALTGIYELIILDIMLPKRDGFSVLKEIRDNGIECPVILLTARTQIDDKVKGLDSGADDYLAKPFHADELLARIRAIGRRLYDTDIDGKLSFVDLLLDPNTLILSSKHSEIKLTIKETDILEYLIRNKNIITSKESIIEKIWGFDTDAEYNNVETHISLLRKKISMLNSKVAIRTIRGRGYTLMEDEKA